MLAVIIVIIIIWISMWGFYKFMYPRAPKSMMPKKGDVTTVRQCNFCGNTLAEYRGVLETNPSLAVDSESSNSSSSSSSSNVEENKALFFCNYEHQADFHAGRVYK